jgi:putative DNA primase/helicase
MSSIQTAQPRPVARDANGQRKRRWAKPRSSYPTTEYRLTDAGNAQRFYALHGQDVRYCYPRKTWFKWMSSHWAPDESGEIERKAKDTVGSIYVEAGAAHQEIRKDIGDHAKRSDNANRLRAMIDLARSEPGIAVMPEDLDTQPHLLNVKNGTLDLMSGELRKHDRADLITRCLPVDFDVHATCPTWTAFLQKSLDGNLALMDFLQRAVGYSLTGHTSDHVLFFLYGNGANGKSTFLNTVAALMGPYGCQLDPDILLQSHGDRHPTGVADLEGARFAVAMEIDEGRKLAESLVKQLTGGDVLAARRMRQDFRNFTPSHKLWIGANHRPKIRGTDDGIWRRMRIIPFEVSIPSCEQDRNLGQKLLRELPGILNWAITGCCKWLNDGLQEPEAVRLATDTYRREEDLLGQFLSEECETGEEFQVGSTAFIDAYNQCTGLNVSQRSMAPRLRSRGFESMRIESGVVWLGVRLRGQGRAT